MLYTCIYGYIHIYFALIPITQAHEICFFFLLFTKLTVIYS